MNIYRQVQVKIMPPKPEFKFILAVEFPYQKTNVWDDQPTGGLFGHKIVPKFQSLKDKMLCWHLPPMLTKHRLLAPVVTTKTHQECWLL